jgi:hypothetical protein
MTKKNQIGLTVDWIAAAVLAASLIVAPSMAYAKSAPLAESASKNFATADTLERSKERKKVWVLPSRCSDKQAKILFDAGFNKPGMLRGAWAITWRESKHESLTEASRWYTGALGTWQIQTSAWSRQPWWSRDDMLDKQKQSEIVRKHFFPGKMYHWGYRYSTKSDSWEVSAGMYYRLWGSSKTYAWVIQPFNTGWSLFPSKCTPKKV